MHVRVHLLRDHLLRSYLIYRTGKVRVRHRRQILPFVAYAWPMVGML